MPAWYELLNSAEIPSPSLIVYPERIEQNLQQMIKLAGSVDQLRPHVKTHKMSQVVEMKRQVGIDKFKVSTIAEAEMVAAAGGKDVLLAYQPVGPNIGRLLQLISTFPETAFSTIVDVPQIVANIGEQSSVVSNTIPLYIDLDVGMGRTGIAPGEAAIQLAELIANTDGVCFAGLHAYDGHLHTTDEEELNAEAAQAFSLVESLRDQLAERGLTVERIIASGTPTFPILAKYPNVEVGCGTSVLWDFGQPMNNPEMGILNAAVLLTRIISKPGTNCITIDLGHKAVASEMPQPRVQFFGLENAETVIHSEEHLTLRVDDASIYQVGDVVYGIPKHICPTVALHEEVWVAKEGRAEERWPVVARKRRITI